MKIIVSNTADPRKMLTQLAGELRGKGQIKKDYSAREPQTKDAAASIRVSFGSIGAKDKLLSFLGIRSAKRSIQAERDAAFTEIEQLVKRSQIDGGEQLLANIRTRMQTTGKLRGEDVAQSIVQFLAPDEGKLVIEGGLVAPSATRPINLMNVSAMRVQCDHAIVRFATLANAIRSDRALDALTQRVDKEMSKILGERGSAQDPRGAGETFQVRHDHLASKNMTVMADLAVEGEGYQNKFITSDDLKDRYKQALAGKSGTVVLEPLPDDATQKDTSSRPVYTYEDEHLRAMLSAVSEAIKEAKDSKSDLRVTIATADKALFDRIQRLNDQPAVAKKPGLFQT